MGELMQGNGYSMRPEAVNTEQLKASILNTLSDDPHLTDVQLIELVSGIMSPDAVSTCQSHMAACSACSMEHDQLSHHLAIWLVPSEIERLEARIGRPEVMNPKSSAPWWARVTEWVPVGSLRASMGAHAAPVDVEVINFPVHEESEIAPNLSGIIQRRGQEFQIRITPSVGQSTSYKDRLVEVVLVESGTENVLLQRNIPINRFVLLGTDLPLRTERIAAKLIT